MAKVIYKYALQFGAEKKQTIQLPSGAEILTVKVLTNLPEANPVYLWALVDEDAPLVNHHFEVFSTGEEIAYAHDTQRKYVGTVFVNLEVTVYVFHVFQILTPLK